MPGQRSGLWLALTALASVAASSSQAQEHPNDGRVHAAGFSVVPPAGWEVRVDPPSKWNAGLGQVVIGWDLDSKSDRPALLFVRGLSHEPEEADSGEDRWIAKQLERWQEDSARMEQIVHDQEDRVRRTGEHELPLLRHRGGFRVDTRGSLRLQVWEMGQEGCLMANCAVFLIYTAWYFPPDYQERHQLFEFIFSAGAPAFSREVPFSRLFYELRMMEAVEASFRDERPASQEKRVR